MLTRVVWQRPLVDHGTALSGLFGERPPRKASFIEIDHWLAWALVSRPRAPSTPSSSSAAAAVSSPVARGGTSGPRAVAASTRIELHEDPLVSWLIAVREACFRPDTGLKILAARTRDERGQTALARSAGLTIEQLQQLRARLVRAQRSAASGSIDERALASALGPLVPTPLVRGLLHAAALVLRCRAASTGRVAGGMAGSSSSSSSSATAMMEGSSIGGSGVSRSSSANSLALLAEPVTSGDGAGAPSIDDVSALVTVLGVCCGSSSATQARLLACMCCPEARTAVVRRALMAASGSLEDDHSEGKSRDSDETPFLAMPDACVSAAGLQEAVRLGWLLRERDATGAVDHATGRVDPGYESALLHRWASVSAGPSLTAVRGELGVPHAVASAVPFGRFCDWVAKADGGLSFVRTLRDAVHIELGIVPATPAGEAAALEACFRTFDPLKPGAEGDRWFIVGMPWWSAWVRRTGFPAPDGYKPVMGDPGSGAVPRAGRPEELTGGGWSLPEIDPAAASLGAMTAASGVGMDRAGASEASPSKGPAPASGAEELGAARRSAAAPLGPIDNDSVCVRGASLLQIGLAPGRDFVLLSERAWRGLLQWYGCKTVLQRVVIRSYSAVDTDETAVRGREAGSSVASRINAGWSTFFGGGGGGGAAGAPPPRRAGDRSTTSVADPRGSGAPGASPALIRSESGRDYVCELELYPLCLGVRRLNKEGRVSTVPSSAYLFSKSLSVAKARETACRHAMADAARARIWYREEPDSTGPTASLTPLTTASGGRWEPLYEDAQTLESLDLTDFGELLVETKAEDGSWVLAGWDAAVTGGRTTAAAAASSRGGITVAAASASTAGSRFSFFGTSTAAASASGDAADDNLVPAGAAFLTLEQAHELTRTAHGGVGLANLGNTCYLSSSLQCLAHTPLLNEYFLCGDHAYDLNPSSSLGQGGRMAAAYGELVRSMWTGERRSIAPRRIKTIVSEANALFKGFSQQDAQELLDTMLSTLSEELNRNPSKPYVEMPDSDGRPDAEVAEEWWVSHLRRERSIIVALFSGQFRSSLRCRHCGSTSCRFEPFTILQLPLPETRERAINVTLHLASGATPVTVGVLIDKDATVGDLVHRVCAMIAEDGSILQLAAEEGESSGPNAARTLDEGEAAAADSAGDIGKRAEGREHDGSAYLDVAVGRSIQPATILVMTGPAASPDVPVETDAATPLSRIREGRSSVHLYQVPAAEDLSRSPRVRMRRVHLSVGSRVMVVRSSRRTTGEAAAPSTGTVRALEPATSTAIVQQLVNEVWENVRVPMGRLIDVREPPMLVHLVPRRVILKRVVFLNPVTFEPFGRVGTLRVQADDLSVWELYRIVHAWLRRAVLRGAARSNPPPELPQLPRRPRRLSALDEQSTPRVSSAESSVEVLGSPMAAEKTPPRESSTAASEESSEPLGAEDVRQEPAPEPLEVDRALGLDALSATDIMAQWGFVIRRETHTSEAGIPLWWGDERLEGVALVPSVERTLGRHRRLFLEPDGDSAMFTVDAAATNQYSGAGGSRLLSAERLWIDIDPVRWIGGACMIRVLLV